MKKLIFLFLAASVAFSSCKKDDDNSSSGGSGGGGGGSNTDTNFYIKWTMNGTNYNLTDATESYELVYGSESSFGAINSCYTYDGTLYDNNELGKEASIGFNWYCFANDEWGTDAFFSIFQTGTYEYSYLGNTGGYFSYFDNSSFDSGNSDVAQPGSSTFNVTSVTPVTPALGSPYVIVKGTFNCTLNSGDVVTNGSFRVACEM